MTMTLKVYEVNRAGAVRVLRPEAEVEPVTTADPTAAYPDCECRRCIAAGGDPAYRALIGHTTQCATCRAGVPCVTAMQLGRTWRDSR